MKLLQIALLLILTLTGQAQEKKDTWASDWKVFRGGYTFDNNETKMNVKLGSEVVDAVVVDNLGLTWFASNGKLLQYNGEKIKAFGKLPISPRARITALACDSKNHLWIGANEGLLMYDGNEWKKMEAGTEVQPILNINEILIDKNDKVWISGWNSNAMNKKGAGLSVYDGKLWTNYNERDGELPKKFVEDMIVDKEGNIWVSMGFNDNGVGRFDGKTWTIFTTENSDLPSNTVRDIVVDIDGNILFGTPKGIARFDGKTWETQDLRNFFNNKFLDFFVKNSDLDILTMALDYQGVLWVGTRGQGVYRIQGRSKTILNTKNSPLSSDYVKEIYIDPNDNKWFITGFSNENWKDVFTINDEVPERDRYKGVVMYGEPNYKKYDNWHIYNRYTIPLRNAQAYDFTEDSDGNIYCGTADGLIKISSDRKEWSSFKNKEGGLFAKTLNKVAITPTGEIWTSSLGGLFKLEGESLKQFNKKNSAYDAKNSLDLFPGKENGIWTSDYKNVIFFDGKTCTKYGKKEGVPGGSARSIIVDKNGNVWAGTLKGVGMFDGKTWMTYNKKETGLTGNEIWSVAEDHNGRILVGTRKGLDIFDGEKWEHIKKFGDLPGGATITAIAVDKNNNIWLGTYGRGILKYDSETKTWTRLNGENSGVYLKLINGLHISKDNNLWIGASRSTLGNSNSSAGISDTESEEYKINKEINKKIKKFEPTGAIIRHQLN